MAVVETISKLSGSELSEKQEHYLNIAKLISDNAYDDLNSEHIKNLCCIILDDLKNETNELPQLVKLMQCLFLNKHLQKFLPESEKIEIVKSIINIVDSNQHENILVNCFSVLIQISPLTVENPVLNELLGRMEDILSKKNDAASTYTICRYFQKFLKDYEEKLSDFIPLISKLVFLPLCHPSTKVREVAEKTLDAVPKLLLYTPDEEASNYLLKLIKETYSRSLLLLFRDKQELYALKVWKHAVNALGNALHPNLAGIMPFFAVLEKGFKSPSDEICIASFITWKSLINSFASSNGVLNDSKTLRFILKPFKNIARLNENIVSVACDTWWHLVWNLAKHLSGRFSEVCIPLLELTVGKISNGYPEKTFPKGGPVSKEARKCCFILLRFLEQPPNESFNRLSSPKKLPNIPYPSLQVPLDIKIITHHFKEILHAFKIIIEVCGTKEDMKIYLDCLMKSVLFIVSTVIEDSNKEAVEAVTHYLNFLTDIIEAKSYAPLLCLKTLESLSKLPRKVLVSHCFSCGSRKSQDILCTTLLKLLLKPHLFPSEAPKRFFAAYNRLVQAGIYESFHALSITHKFMHIIRGTIGGNTFDAEVLIEIWSGISNTLLETIEKTQEVNQGDKQEHDFSCMYDVLIFPFEFIFQEYVQQFRIRPALKLWTNLYKAFIRSASLVPTTTSNEACENFCFKLKELLKEDFLKKPHFFESVCLIMQSVIESIDFTSGTTSTTQGIVDVALMIKRKKPLGNFTSLVDLLAMLLNGYHAHYIEAEDPVQSTPPTIQRKLHIVKNAVPLDILKTFFGNLKSGSVISFALQILVDPISKLFLKSSQKRNLVNHIDAKLELVWNVLSTSIERHYLGPFDSEFLALMTPLLEATFSHPKRHLKERSRRFWFATFGTNTSSLKFPDSLKTLLKKMKLPLLSDDISPIIELSASPPHDSISEDCIVINAPTLSKPAVTKGQPFKTPLSVNGEAVAKVLTKENKQPPKVSIDDLPGEEFVKIDSPTVTTPRRRGIRKRKSFVPTLYNDLSQDTANLSQDTANLMSSSESQDTINSILEEQTGVKESVIETEAGSVSTNNKNAHYICKSVEKSLITGTCGERLDKTSRPEHILKMEKEESCTKSPETDAEAGNKIKVQKSAGNMNKSKTNSAEHGQKFSKIDLGGEKISVFSKPGEKHPMSRNTRRNAKLSQSFSVDTIRQDSEKLECQKLNKSCVETIILSDSEEMIPSSQGSSDTENNSKISINNSKYLSVGDGNLKSSFLPNLNKNVALLPLLQSSPGSEDFKRVRKDDFIKENLNVKVITSTPSKSKMPLINMGEELTEIKSHKDISKCVTELSSNSAENKAGASLVDVEALNKEFENTVTKSLDNHSNAEIPSNTKEDITDLNFLMDAVVNLVDAAPTESSNASVPKTAQSPPEVEMEDISASRAKVTIAPTSNVQEEKVLSKIEPATKKPRLSLNRSKGDFSQSEVYTQKLRKKSINTSAKSQPKPKRKKSILNVAANIYNDAKNNSPDIDENTESKNKDSCKGATNFKSNIKNGKNSSHIIDDTLLEDLNSSQQANDLNKEDTSNKNSNDVSSINENLQSEDINSSKGATNLKNDITDDISNLSLKNESIQSGMTDTGKIHDIQKNKIASKQCEQICLTIEKKDDLETSHLEEKYTNLTTKLNIEIDSLNGNMKVNSNNDRIDGYLESCEVFESSENYCKELHDKEVPDELVSSNSNDLGHTELKVGEKSSNDACITEGHINSSQTSDKISHASASSNVSESSIKDRYDEKLDDANITFIPSSLDDDDSLGVSNKLMNVTDVKTKCTEEELGMQNVIKSSVFVPSSVITKDITVQNNKSELLSVEFSDTEDISVEMHKIVDAIVDASIENSQNDSFSGNRSTESKGTENLQSSAVSFEKDGKFSDLNRKSHTFKKEPEDNPEILSQFSDDSAHNDGNSITAFSYDSSDVMSCNSEDELESCDEILQNSDAMDIKVVDSSLEKNECVKSVENSMQQKAVLDNIIEKSVSETCSKIFAPELDHSYSSLEQQFVKSMDSHENECSSIKSEIELVDIRCNEGSENSELSQEKNIQSSEIVIEVPLYEINLSGVNKTVESSSNVTLNDSNNDIPKIEIPAGKAIRISDENEIGCIIKELIVRVEKLNSSTLDIVGDSTYSAFNYDINLLENPSNGLLDTLILPNSKNVANKENQLASSSDDSYAKGSKKRKIKPPIRSPFNFRQRSKMENSKKLSIKNINSLSVSQIKSMSQDKELVMKTFFPKDDENTENMAKIISSIVDSVSEDDDIDSEMLSNLPSTSQMPKGQIIELSNEELTNVNTRLNASIAPETRRSKLIAAAASNSDVAAVCPENSSCNLSSILKKRKSSTSVPPAKLRKVTFASPLIHEVVIENCSDSRGIETVTLNRLQNLTKKRKKILQEKNKTEKTVTVPVPNESEDVPSSSEYQDSDVLDFCDLPVSPALINCPDDVANILKDLTSPSWIRGLESLLFSKNIKTIGEVCKMNIHQVKELPFKSPKILTLHKALTTYVTNTQESTLKKLKTIDDGSYEGDTMAASSSENSKIVKKTDDDDSKLIEENVKELLEKDQLEKLPLNILGQLIEACGKAITNIVNKNLECL